MGEERLGCMVRDPRRLYCYWQLASDALERVAAARSPGFVETSRWVLRVSPDGARPRDVEIDGSATSCYVTAAPGTRYRVELGLATAQGEFVPLAAGGEVETPPEPLGRLAARDWGRLGPLLERYMEQVPVGSSATSPGGPASAGTESRAGAPEGSASGEGRTGPPARP